VSPAAGSSPLRALELGHDYGDLVALEELDLEVMAGERVALVGHNGAGKSTLLALAAGLLEPSHGWIQIGGAAAGSIEARAATSYVPDSPVLYDDLSLDEHMEYIGRLHGVGDWARRSQSILERLSLDEWGGNLPTQFSRGMRQKASIAIGLIRPFSLLLADEPFDGLDPGSRLELDGLLDEARGEGAAILVSTHRAEGIESATRCVGLHDGTLVYDGPPELEKIPDFLGRG
jgi:ABC-type multidrug transport system ATPase subunit